MSASSYSRKESYMPPDNRQQYSKYLNIAVAAALIIGLFLIISSWLEAQTTGLVSISTPDDNATISLTAENRDAKIIGTGSLKVRLKSGKYLIAASDSGKQARAVVNVQKKAESKIYIDPSQATGLPTVNDVNFLGIPALLSDGLTVTQVNKMKLYLFEFKPQAKNIEILSSTIRPNPHNPDADTSFSTNFDVLFDSARYSGIIHYKGLDDLVLTLNDAHGNTVFNSQSAPAAQSD